MLRPTECLLGGLRGLILVSRVDFEYALANLALAAVFAEHFPGAAADDHAGILERSERLAGYVAAPLLAAGGLGTEAA